MNKNQTPGDNKAIILDILVSFLEGEDWTGLGDFLQHVKFDINSFTDPKDFISAWLGHYRVKKGEYDGKRAINDFATWPPIAARIAELRAEQR